MPNLISLTCSNVQILDKTQTKVFSISGFLVISLIDRNCHNSRTSHDIGRTLAIATSLWPFYLWPLWSNLEARFRMHKFSLITIFYLTKTENRTKKYLIELSYDCFEWRYYFFSKNTDFLLKRAGFSKFKGVLAP